MPNRQKSNLKIKQRKKSDEKKKSVINQRKQQIKEILTDVDLVFGFDNGSTGTICSWIIGNNQVDFQETPSKTLLNYQKDINYIDRIDHQKLKSWINLKIKQAISFYKHDIRISLIIERPMVNPQRFDASLKAVRAFESTIVILQQLGIKYIVIDSKEWQHYFFGKDTMFIDLKLASKKLGKEIINGLSPDINKNLNDIITIINKHGDADALLITKYAIEKLLK